MHAPLGSHRKAHFQFGGGIDLAENLPSYYSISGLASSALASR